jgi:hypothetical protein
MSTGLFWVGVFLAATIVTFALGVLFSFWTDGTDVGSLTAEQLAENVRNSRGFRGEPSLAELVRRASQVEG